MDVRRKVWHSFEVTGRHRNMCPAYHINVRRNWPSPWADIPPPLSLASLRSVSPFQSSSAAHGVRTSSATRKKKEVFCVFLALSFSFPSQKKKKAKRSRALLCTHRVSRVCKLAQRRRRPCVPKFFAVCTWFAAEYSRLFQSFINVYKKASKSMILGELRAKQRHCLHVNVGDFVFLL